MRGEQVRLGPGERRGGKLGPVRGEKVMLGLGERRRS